MIRSILCNLHVVAVVAALVATSSPAHAEEPDPVATALFRDGRDRIAQGDWASGCEKLAQSFARQANASALLNLARCDEHEGKVATAWARHHQAIPLLQRVADPVRREELLRVAREGISRLEPQLPKLQVVTQQGDVVANDESGRAVPVGADVPLDPGPHEITARAPGHREASFRIHLTAGRTTQLVVRLEPAATSPSPASPLQSPASAVVSPLAVGQLPADAKRAPIRTSPLRTWGWIVGGVGVASLTASGISGLFAMNANDRAASHCDANRRCTEEGLRAADSARTFANVGTITFISGAVLVASGVTLLLLGNGQR